MPGGVSEPVAVVLFDHIAKMDAYAELDAALGGRPALRSMSPFCISRA